MPKIIRCIFCIFFFFFIVGCDMSNSPTNRVDELMNKYQTLDNDIVFDINNVIDNNDMNEEQANRYEKLLKKQYQNLSYEIKDEKIDGDVATVVVEIKVIDFRSIVDKVEDKYIGSREYGGSSYIDYKLDELEKAKDKIIYTINFTCTKDEYGNWDIDNLTNLDMQKIQGMY